MATDELSEDLEVHRDWYYKQQHLYTGLADMARSTIESLLRQHKMDYRGVTCRTKTTDSFLQKIVRKGCRDPRHQITDLAGIRVITYVASDVAQVCDLISQCFEVHADLSYVSDSHSTRGTSPGVRAADESQSNSKNNGQRAGQDNKESKARGKNLEALEPEYPDDYVGYRAPFLVCSLGTERSKLPEFMSYKDLRFEVQVRTVLQHAWTEMEQEPNLRFGGMLPTEMQRRLLALSATLELVDREFAALSKDIDAYAEEASRQAKSGELDVEINTTSLIEYLQVKLNERWTVSNQQDGQLWSQVGMKNVVKELREFGTFKIADVDTLLTEEAMTHLSKTPITNYAGLLRAAMLYADPQQYCRFVKTKAWNQIPSELYDVLRAKHGEGELSQMLNEADIRLPKSHS